MTQQKIRFTLRLPERLYNEIDKKSKYKGMSKNAYILCKLEEFEEKHVGINLDKEGKKWRIKQIPKN